jgi:hypothetical protein
LLDGAHHLTGVGAAQAQHQPFNGFALAIACHRAIARELAKLYLGHIAHPHHLPLLGAQHGGLDIVNRLDGPFGANDQRLLARIQAPCPVIAVAVDQRGLQLRQGHAAGQQGGRVRHDLKGAHTPTQAVDIRYTRQRAQSRADDPIQHAAALFQRLGALQREHEHLAQWRGDRGQAAAGVGRQVLHHAVQALIDLLARPIDLGAIFKVQRDVGQRVLGCRAQHLLPGYAQQLLLDGHGDAGLDLFRRHAWRLEDDLDLRGRHIREGVDGQPQIGHGAGCHQHRRQDQHQHTLAQ